MPSFEEQRPASWRLCFIILILRSLGGVCRSTGSATGSPLAPSLPGPTLQRKVLGQEQEIGSPSELAWQAWLLVEDKHGGQNLGLDSSNILRRITPKSIFIAPELSCPNGSSSDGKGGCKLDPIKVDEDAQRQFWLKRLNALYGKQNASKTKKPGEAGAGPLQINIPISALGVPIKLLPTANASINTESSPVVELPLSLPTHLDKTNSSEPLPVDREAIPVVVSQQSFFHGNDSENSSQDAVAVVIYELQSNDTTRNHSVEMPKHEGSLDPHETESRPSQDPSTTDKYVISQEGHAVVPVTEVSDEVNETLSAGVVNDKIHSGLESTLNQSSGLVDEYVGNSTNPGLIEKSEYLSERSDGTSPTVVLLTNSTTSPLVASPHFKLDSAEVIPADHSLDERKSEEDESTTIQMIESETRLDMDPSIQTVIPLGVRSSTVTNAPALPKVPGDEDLETTDAHEESHFEQHSAVDHGDYSETTYQEDLDDFSEGEDELLKPGEASLMVTAQHGFDRLKSFDHTSSAITNLEDFEATTLVELTTEPASLASNSPDTEDTTDDMFKTNVDGYTEEDTKDLQTTRLPTTTISTDAEGAIDTTTHTMHPLRAESQLKNTSTTTPTITSNMSSTHQPLTAASSRTEPSAKYETYRTIVTENDPVTIEPQFNLATQNVPDTITTLGSRGAITYASKTTKVPFASEPLSDVIFQSDLPPFAEIRRISPDELARGKLPFNLKHKPNFFKDDAISDIDNNDDVNDESDDDDKHSLPMEFRDQMQFRSSRPSSSDGANDDESAAASISSPRFAELIKSQQQRGYGRFPSDEVNSIHNLDGYKEHLRSPYRSRDSFVSGTGGVGSSTSSKSRVAGRLKSDGPSQWRPLTGFSAPPTQQQRLEQRQQKQKPMLLRFWARMPLVRDLSFYPSTSHGSHNEPIGGVGSRSAPATSSTPMAHRQQYGGQHKDALPYDPVNTLPRIGG